MKKQHLILILLVNTGFGQIIISDTSEINMAEKLILFQTERKSPTLSAFINIIPTAGYAYAGDWKRGLKIKGAEFLILIISSVVLRTNPKEVLDYRLFLVWEFFDVAKTTTKYNNQLYKNIFGKEPPWKANLNPHPKG